MFGKSDDENSKAKGATVNITSYNQTGGITAQNVHVHQRLQRRMTEDMKASLLQALTNDRPVTVLGLNGDTESCAYASEIAEFLKANGYNATCSWHMFFNPPVHTVKISPFNEGKEWHLVVGPAA